jgi:hypothetical protein
MSRSQVSCVATLPVSAAQRFTRRSWLRRCGNEPVTSTAVNRDPPRYGVRAATSSHADESTTAGVVL